jgi:predicted NBD/HSP70 family sugar kinase
MSRQPGHRAETLRVQGALAMLRCAHRYPGITRAEAASRLGLSSGSATEIMNRLRAARLLAEEPIQPTGGRGRPTAILVPHPVGPIVAVVEISHETWKVTTAEVGGNLAAAPVHRHRGQDADAVLRDVAAALTELHRAHGARLRAVGVSIPGAVHGSTMVEATNLRWRELNLSTLADLGTNRLPLAVGNDASLAGVAEALRGASRNVSVALHLTVEVGVGGVLLIDGRPVLGATGAGGEFGHMPFGDPDLRCPCGAYGCWDLTVDGRAMARYLARRAPTDPRSFADRTVRAARAGAPPAVAATTRTAEALGRGIAALINALDPAIVTLGGLGADLLDIAPRALTAAVHRGVMTWRHGSIPPIVPASLGPNGPAIGAAEAALAEVLTEQTLRRSA